MSIPARVVADSLRTHAASLDEALGFGTAADLRRRIEHVRDNLLNSANFVEDMARRRGTWDER